MTTRLRLIRFARVENAPADRPADEVIVGRVLLHEPAMHAGDIARDESGWIFRPVDVTLPSLCSELSRQDLERQITLLFFGEIPALAEIEPIVAAPIQSAV